MNNLFCRCTVLVLASIALIGCKSPEVKARSILDKHAAEYSRCQKMLVEAQGSGDAVPEDDPAIEAAEECLNEVKGKIEADRQASGVGGEAFAKVWAEWVAEMEAKAGE